MCTSVGCGFRWASAFAAQGEKTDGDDDAATASLRATRGRAPWGMGHVWWGPTEVVEVSSYKEFLWQMAQEAPTLDTVECDGCCQRYSRRQIHKVSKLEWLCGPCLKMHRSECKAQAAMGDREELQTDMDAGDCEIFMFSSSHACPEGNDVSLQSPTSGSDTDDADALAMRQPPGRLNLGDMDVDQSLGDLKALLMARMRRTRLAAGFSDPMTYPALSCTSISDASSDTGPSAGSARVRSEQQVLRSPSAYDQDAVGDGAPSAMAAFRRSVKERQGQLGVALSSVQAPVTRAHVRKAAQRASVLEIPACLSVAVHHKLSKRVSCSRARSHVWPLPAANETNATASEPEKAPVPASLLPELAFPPASAIVLALSEDRSTVHFAPSSSQPFRLAPAPSLPEDSTPDLVRSSLPRVSMSLRRRCGDPVYGPSSMVDVFRVAALQWHLEESVA